MGGHKGIDLAPFQKQNTYYKWRCYLKFFIPFTFFKGSSKYSFIQDKNLIFILEQELPAITFKEFDEPLAFDPVVQWIKHE